MDYANRQGNRKSQASQAQCRGRKFVPFDFMLKNGGRKYFFSIFLSQDTFKISKFTAPPKIVKKSTHFLLVYYRPSENVSRKSLNYHSCVCPSLTGL